MSVTDTTAELAADAERVMAIWLEGHRTGRWDEHEYAAMLTGGLRYWRAQSIALQDAALANELTILWRRYVAPLGLELLDESDRIEGRVYDVITTADFADDDRAVEALGVLARDEIFSAGQLARQEAMHGHGVETWTRETNTGCCEVCADLADGLVSVDEVMWTHKGCGCIQKPTN